MDDLARVVERLVRRAKLAAEREATAPDARFGDSVSRSDYAGGLVRASELAARAEGRVPDELLGGERRGEVLLVERELRLENRPTEAERGARRAVRRLDARLDLVHGIRERTAARLAARGITTLEDLARDERFGEAARHVLSLLRSDDGRALQRHVERRFGASSPVALATWRRAGRFAVLDIETMGLDAGVPAFLVGLGLMDGDRLRLVQVLALSLGGEAEMIARVAREVRGRALVTYNGRSFDVPFLRGRSAYHGLEHPFDALHYDLLGFTRRAYAGKLPDFRLATVGRRLFGVGRENDVPSALVPLYYKRYLDTGNCGTLVPVVRHNAEDVVTTARLFRLLSALVDEGERGRPANEGRPVGSDAVAR